MTFEEAYAKLEEAYDDLDEAERACREAERAIWPPWSYNGDCHDRALKETIRRIRRLKGD